MLIADDPKKTVRSHVAYYFSLFEFIWWWPISLWVQPQVHHYVYVPHDSKTGKAIKWIIFFGPLQIIRYKGK